MNLAHTLALCECWSVKFLRENFHFFSFLHVFAGQWLVQSKVLCIPSDCESRNNFVLVEERGVAKNWMLPSLLMNPSFKSQMLYIIKPNWADYQENSVIQKNKREKSLCFMKEEVVPKRGWNVKNAFSIWIPHIDCPVSSFSPLLFKARDRYCSCALGLRGSSLQDLWGSGLCQPRSVGLVLLCQSPA